MSLPKGALLARAGEPPQHVAFIVRGLVRLYFTGADGQEWTYDFRHEDHFVCAHSAVRDAVPAAMSAQALEACQLLVASCRAFWDLCDRSTVWRG
ncbi:Crp/Fnr family transcriptional regulator [Streptacidiphilus monticola]